MSRPLRPLLVSTSLAMATVAVGCGGDDELPRQAVSGDVTLDGKPLEAGVIEFQPDASQAQGEFATAVGAVIQDGSYRFPGSKGRCRERTRSASSPAATSRPGTRCPAGSRR